MKNFKFLIILSIVGLVLPNFIFAQEELGQNMPQTLGEAKNFVLNILSRLPEATIRVWKEEALPVLGKVWEWVKPVIEPWRQKLMSLLNKEVEKRKPDLEQEFKKETEEMQNDLWQRLKDAVKKRLSF